MSCSCTVGQTMVQPFYTTLTYVDLAQYEIFRPNVCDFWPEWCNNGMNYIVDHLTHTVHVYVLKLNILLVKNGSTIYGPRYQPIRGCSLAENLLQGIANCERPSCPVNKIKHT